MTAQLYQYIITCFADLRSATSIAKECHCSVIIPILCFNRVSYPRLFLPEVIAIDEFKGNSGGHKYQCILAAPVNKKILDILPCRRQEELCEYFSQFPMEEPKKVHYVVMDMSGSFSQ